MRTKYQLLLSGLFVTVLCSCEKVIDVNVNDADSRYVVEGVVTNQSGQCMVLISKTKSIDDDNSFAGVGGASVTITDDGGNTISLTATDAGVYTAPALTGMPGTTYTLQVDVDGQTFTASSTMPDPVPMDTIFITDDKVVNDTRKLVNVMYQDPAGVTNYYRFIQYVNGVKEQNIFVRNDDLIDGNLSTIKLRYQEDDDDDKIKPGDQVQVDMWCIDAAVYKYWYSFNQGATGSGSSAAPANPVSNIKGGALGYFSAHTLDRKTMKVP